MRLNLRFRRLVFAQILLGIVAFCIAEVSPGMLLITGALAVLSWYLTEGPAGRPFPRWLINTFSVVAIVWLLYDLFVQHTQVVIAMGHFTIWLQVLLLYTEKSNRDYGQLLVLSLMTMISASIVSVSMLYGLLLAAYCVLGLVTLIHFQFKATWDTVTDQLKAAAPEGTAVVPPRATVGRGYDLHLRSTAVCLGLACAVVAAGIFVATPRALEATPVGRLPAAIAARKTTGFSQSVNLRAGAPESGSQEPVLNMSVRVHGEAVANEIFLLRGAVLDDYDGRTKVWTRSYAASVYDDAHAVPAEGWMPMTPDAESVVEYEAQITLREGGHRTLFAQMPTTYLASSGLSSVYYSPLDGQMSSGDSVPGAVAYTLRWPRQPLVRLPFPPVDVGESADEDTGDPDVRRRLELRAQRSRRLIENYARSWPDAETPRVATYAESVLRPYRQEGHTLSDADVTRILANHLRETFAYSLSNPAAPAGADPVSDFLLEQRRGHCELFASGLAAMARSLGMQARVVTGYRVSEYNPIGGYYVVRHDDAHAWTEVYLDGENPGWQAFDATPPDAVRAEHAVSTAWTHSARQLYEAIEYEWLRSIVAFDQRTRAAVLTDLKSGIGTPDDQATWLGQVWAQARRFGRLWEAQKFNYTAIFVIVITISVAVASLARTLIVRRRRLLALQLTSLSRRQRRGLAGKLRFYLTMLELLERHGHVRPAWQTPFAFAEELAQANPLRFDPVVALTEMFYEVRFGHRDVDKQRKARIKAHLRQLEAGLSSP